MNIRRLISNTLLVMLMGAQSAAVPADLVAATTVRAPQTVVQTTPNQQEPADQPVTTGANSDGSETAQHANANSVTVEINAQGFVAAVITVTVGSQVTWVNSSDDIRAIVEGRPGGSGD